MPTRLQIARQDIFELLDSHNLHVFRKRDLDEILSKNRDSWRLAQRTNFNEFTKYLIKSGKLKRMDFPFPYRKEIRYVWGEVPFFEVLLTVKPSCHFSHYTAVQMHELTEQDPKTIYLNHEQRPSPVPASGLEQGRIDAAFKRKPRVTNNVIKFGDYKICLINGKHTGYLGIEERTLEVGPEKTATKVRLTDLERTLIDISVRPFYAGGVAEVAKAYRLAAPKASVNRLAGMLKQLNYVYPYHQAIGFYLERSAAYKPSVIELFRSKFERQFDFYVTYHMNKTRYDDRWKLHVPDGF